jgi:hypothetical protein
VTSCHARSTIGDRPPATVAIRPPVGPTPCVR